MNNYKRYTVTAALPYANGPLHIGHIAGAYLPADIYVRYLRLKGKDVVFIGGSDEHGAAITIKAKKEGTIPQTIIDKYHTINKNAFRDFGISFDQYDRTSSPLHHKTASEYFKTLNEKGVFIEQVSEQHYDEGFNQFLADRYIIGTCPKCSNEGAYGDQCERCGSSLSPTELINPISTLSGSKPILKKTKHWYLPLEKYQVWLKEWLNDEKSRGEKLKKNVSGQCNSWLNDGLSPRAITRDLDWGVKVPLQDAEGKVLYVWLDAPIGYISATKQWAIDNDKDWKPYWQDKDTKLIHFIGKDNIVFHCIIFPAILKAHGDYILPTNVAANEFMNLEGDKISTSHNWAVWLHEYMDDFPEKQDILRYVLCSNAPETKDSEFRWKDFQARNNNELVATLGNFINRVLVLSDKYFDGKVQQADDSLPIDIKSQANKVAKLIEGYKFRDAQIKVLDLARAGNQYLAETEPWKIIKQNREKVGAILANATTLIANITIVLEPFLPNTAVKVLHMLNLNAETLAWDKIGTDIITTGHRLNKPSLLFDKIEDAVINQQIAKLEASKKASTKAVDPIKPTIEFDDFTNLDIRTATIIGVTRVPKVKKLLQLRIDLGFEQRTVVSGIAENFQPEDIIGKKVSVLCNLTPRKIHGVLSNGMILMVENRGRLQFLSPDKSVDNGSIVS